MQLDSKEPSIRQVLDGTMFPIAFFVARVFQVLQCFAYNISFLLLSQTQIKFGLRSYVSS